MKDSWYRLDNAAKIFPMVRSKFDTSSFRLACVLKEDVDPAILLQASKNALERFPSFKVKLKTGFFWYYLETNHNELIIFPESPILCSAKLLKEQNDYLFKIMYFGKRISMEFFHAVSDGTGGMELFKAIIYHYLVLKGIQIPNHSNIITEEVEESIDERQDSFYYNYNKKAEKFGKEPKAFIIEGFTYKTPFMGALYLILDEKTLKAAAHKHGATIGEYLSALLIYGTYKEYYEKSGSKKPIRLFLPVNVRKYFNSLTLRNFALFIRTTSYFKEDVTLESVIKDLKGQFVEQLAKEKIESRLAQNMNFEKNPFVRFCPMFLKKPIARAVYKQVSTNVSTISLSNLGKIDVPEEFKELVERFEFVIPASVSCPINGSAVAYNNLVVFTLTNRILERKLQKLIVDILNSDGVKMVIETNDMEALA